MQNKKKKITTVMIVFVVFILGCVAVACGGSKKKNTKSGKTQKVHGSKTVKSNFYVDFKEKNSWQSGEKNFTQYDMEIHNDSSKEIKSWCVVLKKKNSKIEQNWNSAIKEEEDKYQVIPVDYNSVISSKSFQKDVGIIASSSSQEKIEVDSVKVTYSDGTHEKVKGDGKKSSSKAESTQKSSEAENKEKNKTKNKANDPEKSEKKESNQTQEKTTVPTGRLHVQGTKLVDSTGKVVQLKGVSTHGIAWYPDYVNKDALKTLKDVWNVNVFRIAMYTNEYGGYCNGGDKEHLKKLVDQGVKYATENGMYVIIDWHILSDANPNINKGEAIKFFDEMSKKYASNENVFYEICNEPQGSDWNSVIKPYASDVVKTIRANDQNAVILVGTNTWSQDVDQVIGNQLEDKNVMYVLHFYAGTHKDNIRGKLTKAINAGVPVFVTECSITDASGNGAVDYDSANQWLKLLNDNDISFVAWSLSNKDESSALIKPGCSKKSGWTDDDLSETGKWFKKAISGK